MRGSRFGAGGPARRLAAAALAAVAAGCAGDGATAGTGSASAGAGLGIVVVTDGGTALVDGAADVPPTLDLRIQGGAAVAGALPSGAEPEWRDATHLRAAWTPAPPAGRLSLPAGLPTARGSRLGGPLDVDLGSAPAAGTLRTAWARIAAPGTPPSPLP